MKALVFLKLRQWKNAIIKALKTPAKLALIVIYGIALIVMLLVMGISPMDRGFGGMTDNGPIGVVAFVLLLAFVFSFFAVKSGTKGVNRIFTEADAHILFSSPFRPQSLLIYGLSNQLLTGIFSSVFLVFQFGNFINFGIRGAQMVVIFVAWILIAFLYALIRSLTYVIADRFSFGKTAMNVYAYLVLALLVAAVLLSLQQRGSIGSMSMRFLNLPWLRYFPIAGWVAVVIEGLMLGMQMQHWICLALFLLSIPLTFAFIYRRPVDFYEDAQLFAKPQNLDISKNNLTMQDLMQMQSKKIKISYVGIGGGEGASTFFYKQVLEKRRKRKFFLVWAFLGYLLEAAVLVYASLGLGMFQAKWLPVIFASHFLLTRFMFSTINPIAFELTNPYYLLYPLGAFERSFLGQLAGLLFQALDILPAYLLFVVFGRLHLIPALLLFLVLLSTSMVTTAAYLLTYGIAGNPNKGLYALLLMAISSVFIFPSLIGLIVFGIAIGAGASLVIASICLLFVLLLNLGIALIAVLAMKMIIAKGQEA